LRNQNSHLGANKLQEFSGLTTGDLAPEDLPDGSNGTLEPDPLGQWEGDK